MLLARPGRYRVEMCAVRARAVVGPRQRRFGSATARSQLISTATTRFVETCRDGAVRLGLHAVGIGTGAERAVIDAVASAAEADGFATLWSGEHIVMVDEPASRYPYANDGKIAVRADADWLDPMMG
jgi:hypothetical protein